jgi:hypothetical protein
MHSLVEHSEGSMLLHVQQAVEWLPRGAGVPKGVGPGVGRGVKQGGERKEHCCPPTSTKEAAGGWRTGAGVGRGVRPGVGGGDA